MASAVPVSLRRCSRAKLLGRAIDPRVSRLVSRTDIAHFRRVNFALS
jgi:hypothetical protein